jgi:phage baseplate assembly protein gpV
MYNGMQIYRAVVTASSSTTGSLYVSIPSVLGTSTSIAVSTIGRAAVSGVWAVPNVGEQVLVAVEDDKFSNVFLLYPVEPPVIAVEPPVIADASVTTDKLANASVTTDKLAHDSVVNENLDMYRMRVSRVAPQTVGPLSTGLIEFDTLDFEKYNNNSWIGGLPSQAIFPQSGLYAISVTITTSAAAGTQTAMLTVDNFVSATPVTSFAGALSIVLTCNMFFYGTEVLSLKVVNSNSSLSRSYTAMLSMILLTE